MNQKRSILDRSTPPAGGIQPYQKVIIAIFLLLVSIKYVPKLFKSRCKVEQGDVWHRTLNGTLSVYGGLLDKEITQVSVDSVYRVDQDKNIVYYFYGSDGMTDSCDCQEFTFESASVHSSLDYRRSEDLKIDQTRKTK